MSKHTPGPWSVPHFAEPDCNCECGYVLCDHMMGAVATVHCSGEGADWQKHGDNPKFAEAVANAHLIAAAPEMLAALQWIEPYASVQVRKFPDATDTPEWARLLAVVAKATGGGKNENA